MRTVLGTVRGPLMMEMTPMKNQRRKIEMQMTPTTPCTTMRVSALLGAVGAICLYLEASAAWRAAIAKALIHGTLA